MRNLARILTLVALSCVGGSRRAGPARFGFSDRVERHLFPEVTTGPAGGFRRQVLEPSQRFSIAPVQRLEFLVNGKVAATMDLNADVAWSSAGFIGQKDVDIPEGGWVAARVVGLGSRYVADSYAFAQTTPVYVVRGGKPFVSHEDAKFLADVVDAIWMRANRSPWRSDAERDAFKKEIDHAKAVYVKLAGF